jgi:arginase
MNVRVTGVPMDLGADRRGVDMGPSALRYAELSETVESLGYGCKDTGNLPVPNPESRDPHSEQPPKGSAKYLKETRTVCHSIESAVADTVADGDLPLVLGGDHSIAIGTVRGVSSERDVGVLWLDAHGDFNTPASSPSGNIHGMALAALFGRGSFGAMGWTQADIEEERVAIVGLRDLDSEERKALKDSGIATYTMHDIDSRGVDSVVEDAITRILNNVDALHVSLDLDVLDPNEAPGVGTPVRGGITYREGHTAMELVAETDALQSMEIVEVNPILDSHNQTAELGVELLASAIGRQIL